MYKRYYVVFSDSKGGYPLQCDILLLLLVKHNHVLHESVVDGSSMTRFSLVIGDPEQNVPGIIPGPLGWHTSGLTTELHEVRH